MSSKDTASETNKPLRSPCFVCAEEAAALLNCVADRKYNEMRCYPLVKKLRACVEKKVASDHDMYHCALVAAQALSIIGIGQAHVIACTEVHKG